MNQLNRVFRLIVLISTMLLLAPFGGRQQVVLAQFNQHWTPMQRVPDFDDESKAPIIVADRDRTVHAFKEQIEDDEPVILYRQWTPDHGWSQPVDILLSPLGYPKVLGVLLDELDIFHLVFVDGTAIQAALYYTYAPASIADQVRAWAKPMLLTNDAAIPSTGKLVRDMRGVLHVVYSGKGEGNGLYALHSDDDGATWSDPIPFYFTYDSLAWPVALQVIAGRNGALHAVWTVVNDTGNGQWINYSRLDVETLQWSEALELAIADGYEADWPSIVEYGEELFVIYNNNFPTTRWMRRSTDGGHTWSNPVQPFPHVGEYGPAVLVIDSSNNLHMILGNRMGNPATHGMWHSVWEGGRWRDLRAIVSGPVSKVRGEGFDPQLPALAVVQGNILLAAWSNDHGFNGVWYSTLKLDTPELALVPLATVTYSPTATPTEQAWAVVPTPSPTSRAVPSFVGSENSELQGRQSEPTTVLLIGLTPALVLVLAVVAKQRLAKDPKRFQFGRKNRS